MKTNKILLRKKLIFFRYWRNLSTPTYGNCFTFNSGLDQNNAVRKMTVSGSQNGLILELYLDQTNYMHNKLSRIAGARVTVHDP